MGNATKPRLLDLYCGGGGAGMGYWLAGFDVVGVDIEPQPDYPFKFWQLDALSLEPWVFDGFDAIHASPPCQAHTTLRVMRNAREHVDLVTPTRKLLRASGLPYVIENVPGAPLIDPVTLCGSSFGCGVEVYNGWRQLRRHRLFESNVELRGSTCMHSGQTIGFYGDHARDSRRRPGVAAVDFPDVDKLALGKAALGMPWATLWRSLTQAIPPAYTEDIGEQVMRQLLTPGERFVDGERCYSSTWL